MSLFKKITTAVPLIAALQLGTSTIAQTPQGKTNDTKFEIVDINVVGAEYLDPDILKVALGLQAGDKIYLQNDPAVAKALRNLWNQKLLEDVRIDVVREEGNRVWLEVVIDERQRTGSVKVTGVRNTMETEIKTKLKLADNRMITEAFKVDMKEVIRKYLQEKGFFNPTITIIETPTSQTSNINDIEIKIDKGNKIHVNQITFYGNEEVSDAKLKRGLKGTKERARLSLYAVDRSDKAKNERINFKDYIKEGQFLSFSKTMQALNPYFRYNLFANSKFSNEKFKEDQDKVIELYNSLGYRDARIVGDTIVYQDDKNVKVEVQVDEGQKYYFGDIEFRGNTLYSDSLLKLVINIDKGDVFNRAYLDNKLGATPSMDGEGDIGSLYMDNGHLFFRINAMEKSIIKDTINFVINIVEGPVATIKNIEIIGNTRTNDYVIRRELFTLPGDKFSRGSLIRSIRQVSSLGFIDPEKVNPVPKPNPQDFTVDIDYNVAEKSSDQLEISAGYNGFIGVTGSIGLVFNNFSIRNIFKPKLWDPLPMGDGQKFSVRWQSSGLWYNSGNISFTEPWLGGKKPNSLTIGANWTRISMNTGNMYSNTSKQSANDSYITSIGGNVSYGKRLSWPDDFFVFSAGVSYNNYFLKNYNGVSDLFTNGTANNLHLRLSLSRNSTDQPIFPRSGSNISFTAMITPPYSLFSEKNYAVMDNSEKYRWIEFHKYRFNAEFYQKVYGNLVVKFAAKYGFLGSYNKQLGLSPFEQFQLGGDGLSGYNFIVGRDIVSQRGYEIYRDNANVNRSEPIFNKYVLELRYPFSLKPSATIFGLVFAEGANVWSSMKTYNPLELNRAVGVGIRMHLPMFGLLGLDFGIGLDNQVPDGKKMPAGKFTFMLGMEPD